MYSKNSDRESWELFVNILLYVTSIAYMLRLEFYRTSIKIKKC